MTKLPVGELEVFKNNQFWNCLSFPAFEKIKQFLIWIKLKTVMINGTALNTSFTWCFKLKSVWQQYIFWLNHFCFKFNLLTNIFFKVLKRDTVLNLKSVYSWSILSYSFVRLENGHFQERKIAPKSWSKLYPFCFTRFLGWIELCFKPF